MPRNVNAKALLDTRQTTTCWLLRIDPRGGAAFGLTDTNVDSTVDDGQGLVTYIAAYGYDSAAVSATGGQGVDNSEAQALFAPLADFGITVDMSILAISTGRSSTNTNTTMLPAKSSRWFTSVFSAKCVTATSS